MQLVRMEGITPGGVARVVDARTYAHGLLLAQRRAVTEMEWDEVRQAVAPVEGTADAMLAELTPAQREALARLLEKEIGDL